MLRITLRDLGNLSTIRLEGRLSGPWVEELRRVAYDSLVRAQGLSLDLSEVDFLDAAGAALLRELTAAGVSLLGCSGFVFELLRGIPQRAPKKPSANALRGVLGQP